MPQTSTKDAFGCIAAYVVFVLLFFVTIVGAAATIALIRWLWVVTS